MNRSPGDESETKEEMEHTVFVPIIKLEAPDTEASDENFFQEQGDLKYNFGLLGSEAEDPLAVQEADRLQGSQIKVEVEKDYVEHQNNQNSLLSQVPSSSNSYIETKRGETMPEFERLDVVGTNVNQVLIKEEKDDEKSRFKEEESIDINSIEDEMMVQAGNSDERLQGEHFINQKTDIGMKEIVQGRNEVMGSKGILSTSITTSITVEPTIKISIRCSQCPFSARYPSKLKRHSSVHLEGNEIQKEMQIRHTCEHCSVTCRTLTEMRKHKFSVHGEKTFKCPHCDYGSWLRAYVTTHILTHSEEKRYKCSQCDYSCRMASHLKEHMYVHSGQSPYRCHVCARVFKSKVQLKLHTYSHTGERPFKCTQCPYSAVHRGALNEHTRKNHSLEKPHKCAECEFATTEAHLMRKHMYSHTGDRPKPFLCEFCSKTFAEKGSLKKHLMTHTGMKTYKCTLCPYSSIKGGDLERHMSSHTGVKPFKCDMCDYAGASAGLLKVHSMAHTGVKPKKCPECEYSCRDKKSLEKHMRAHSGEESLKCADCPYATRDAGSLKLHIAWHSRRKKFPRGGRGNPKTEEGRPKIKADSALGLTE